MKRLLLISLLLVTGCKIKDSGPKLPSLEEDFPAMFEAITKARAQLAARAQAMTAASPASIPITITPNYPLLHVAWDGDGLTNLDSLMATPSLVLPDWQPVGTLSSTPANNKIDIIASNSMMFYRVIRSTNL